MEPVTKFSITTSFNQPSLYYHLCEVNGSKFALFSKSIKISGNFTVDLQEYNIILLNNIEVETDICIRGISVVIFNNITSKLGKIEIYASGRLVLLGATMMSKFKNFISGDMGVYMPAVISEDRDMIIKGFNEGFSNQHGPTILDALVDTLDVIQDFYLNTEDLDSISNSESSSGADITEALDFFYIPYTFIDEQKLTNSEG